MRLSFIVWLRIAIGMTLTGRGDGSIAPETGKSIHVNKLNCRDWGWGRTGRIAKILECERPEVARWSAAETWAIVSRGWHSRVRGSKMNAAEVNAFPTRF